MNENVEDIQTIKFSQMLPSGILIQHFNIYKPALIINVSDKTNDILTFFFLKKIQIYRLKNIIL